MNRLMMIGGALCVVAAFLLLIPTGSGSPEVDPLPVVERDELDKAYELMEQLHRDVMRESARRIESGEMTTQTEVQAFESAAFKELINAAMESLMRLDADEMNEAWTPELHAALRRRLAR